MTESLLKNVVNGRVPVPILSEWLLKLDNQDTDKQWTCTKGEFMSYLLNFIHEESLGLDKNDSPQQVHTPKSIRKLQTPRPDSKFKKRQALFSKKDTKPDDLECQPLDASQTNPANSPLYSHSPFHVRKNNRSSADRSLCFGDFLTTSSASKKINLSGGSSNSSNSSSKKKKYYDDLDSGKKQRRINPTNLTQKLNRIAVSESNSFNFMEVNEIAEADPAMHRNRLIEERMMITPVKHEVKIPKIMEPKKDVEINFNYVTCRFQLDILSDVYCLLIKHNFILNLTSELYFIISLILMNHSDEGAINMSTLSVSSNAEVELNRLFSSIHNVVYFGVRTLNKQFHLLNTLDKTTIKLLCLNDRLKKLEFDLTPRLLELYESQDETRLPPDGGNSHVCFMSETDNRENFPNDVSFNAFRKQRDLFYEILRSYESGHGHDSWNFQVALTGRIKNLVNMSTNPANYRHLAKLFKLHLLTTCATDEMLPESESGILSSLPNLNKDKLTRLKNRLIKNVATNGINSPPTFTGRQEFYKEFILTAATHAFNVHLVDTFVSEILVLNDTSFTGQEIDAEGATVDSTTIKSFIICLKSLRLLAKFLGYIESIAYHIPDCKYTERFLQVELASRYWYQPTFNFQLVINDASANGTLSLTIPWITKYLAMLDYVTLRLSYYESIYEILFNIYYEKRGGVLVQLCLGWLFEMPHFPSELYFAWLTKSRSAFVKPKSNSLDEMNIVTKDVLYTCCPYLNEFKSLLQQNSGKQTGASGIKHITPVTAVESPSVFNEKRTRLQLEEAFLNSQSNSVRRTVEFLSERVASACVKQICNRIVPDERLKSLSEFKKVLQSMQSTHNIGSYAVRSEINKMALEFVKTRVPALEEQCLAEAERQINNKIASSVHLLLADDDLKQTKDACATIAGRLCMDRVRNWINTHVNANVLIKEFDVQIPKILDEIMKDDAKEKTSFSLPTLGKPDVQHNVDAPSAINALETVRDMCIQLTTSAESVTEDALLDAISLVERSYKERCDTNECIVRVINQLLVDLCVLTIAFRLEFSSAITERIIDFLRNSTVSGDNFNSLLCARNIAILNGVPAPNSATVWSNLAAFTANLLQTRLLDCDQFESQCLGVYKRDWDPKTLARLSEFFKAVIDRCPALNERFTFLLGFLSDFCSDLEF